MNRVKGKAVSKSVTKAMTMTMSSGASNPNIMASFKYYGNYFNGSAHKE